MGSTTMGLPLKGHKRTITSADGKTAIVKRSGKDWAILYGTYNKPSDSWSHVRWGNARETLADIEHFKLYGTVKKIKHTGYWN